MNIQTAIQIFKKNGIITDETSAIATVVNIRENSLDGRTAEAICTEVCNGFEFSAEREENSDREREVYALYLLKYLSTICVKNRTIAGDSAFTNVLKTARENARKYTHERLYGEMTWLDAHTRAAAAIAKTKPAPTAVSKQAATTPKQAATKAPAVPKKPREPGRVQKIFARVVELDEAGKDRAAILEIITKEFEIANAVTAVTYYNDARRLRKQGKI